MKSRIRRRLESGDDLAGREELSKRDEFIYWAKRFHSMDSFDEQERDYKLKIAERVSAVHDAVCSGSTDWQAKLKWSFASQNLAHHFMHASFMSLRAERDRDGRASIASRPAPA